MNRFNIYVEDYPEDRDLLIPLGITFRQRTDHDISCYHDTRTIADEYVLRFKNDPFSTEAAAFLKERFDAIIAARGYTGVVEDDVVYLLCEAVEQRDGIAVLNAREAKGCENLCEIDLAEADELGQEAFVCVEGDKIVSAAVENYTHKGETEIAVETAEAYRRRGYARAASVALCNDIVASGGSVTWHCSAENTASCALAESIGFKADGREMYFCYYANE